MSASNACARSQKESSERSSRYVPLVWPLIMAPQNLSSRMQRSSSSAAARALFDFTGEEIIGRAGVLARRLDVAFGLHARPGQRQHAAFDAGAIHGIEPHLTEVGQTREKLLSLVRREVYDGWRPIVLEAGAEEVFFNRDLLDHAIPGCSSLPLSVPYSG